MGRSFFSFHIVAHPQDEDPSHAWLYLHENDVVSILQQFPLDAIFAHLLQAPMDESGEGENKSESINDCWRSKTRFCVPVLWMRAVREKTNLNL